MFSKYISVNIEHTCVLNILSLEKVLKKPIGLSCAVVKNCVKCVVQLINMIPSTLTRCLAMLML